MGYCVRSLLDFPYYAIKLQDLKDGRCVNLTKLV